MNSNVASSPHRILIFGGTGATGKYAVKSAVENKDQVFVFVRNPNKLFSDIKDRVNIIQGDLFDTEAVFNSVKTVQPDSIIIASAHVYKSTYAPLNSAAVIAIIKALQDLNIVSSCRLIFLSGMFSSPRDEPLSLTMLLVRYLLVSWIQNWAGIQDNINTSNYLLYECKDLGLQFTIVRMAMVYEDVGNPALVGKSLVPIDGFPGTVSFADMGSFLVKLAHGEFKDKTIGKAIRAYYDV